MERSPVRDFVVGLFVLAGLAALAWLSVDIGWFKWHKKGGLHLQMKLSETGGLNVRAPVVVAGVQVGEVTSISYVEDTSGYRALVWINVDKKLHLSRDTMASVYTAGMLGDHYISLQTGADDQMLKDNDEITMTESAVVLEQILKAVMYGLTKDESKKGATTSPATDAGR